jgi:hypothetical protein
VPYRRNIYEFLVLNRIIGANLKKCFFFAANLESFLIVDRLMIYIFHVIIFE